MRYEDACYLCRADVRGQTVYDAGHAYFCQRCLVVVKLPAADIPAETPVPTHVAVPQPRRAPALEVTQSTSSERISV